jgi:hypothetical protein
VIRSVVLHILGPDGNAEDKSNLIDEMWLEFGKKLVTDTIGGVDDRAKFMLTTCATLIVVQFGLSFAFQIQAYSLILTPQFFLVISAAFFATSLHDPGRAKALTLNSIQSLAGFYAQRTWRKSIWNLIGFSFFVAGLLAFAIMTLVQG